MTGGKPTKVQLLEVLDAVTAKRNVAVSRVMHGMDSMTRQIDTELTHLMQRKRAMDTQDAIARQEIRRAEMEDSLVGNGYVAVRFKDRFGNRPFTAL